MKRSSSVAAAILGVAMAAPSWAQVPCADWHTSAFFEVASASDVTRCFEAGADPNTRGERDRTPLHFAAWYGTAETVKVLLDLMNVDPMVRDATGRTPLHHAGTAETVTLLLAAEANPNAQDQRGVTPLHRAVESMSDVGIVPLLIAAGADLDARDQFGSTPLHSGRTAEAVTALLEAGADVNARRDEVNGETPLHSMAALGNAEGVTALLGAGADPNARDEDGRMPRDYALENSAFPGEDLLRELTRGRF